MVIYEPSDPWYVRHSEGLCAVGLVALVIFMCVWIAINF